MWWSLHSLLFALSGRRKPGGSRCRFPYLYLYWECCGRENLLLRKLTGGGGLLLRW